MKLSFALPKAKAAAATPPKRVSALSALEEDDSIDVASNTSTKASAGRAVQTSSTLSRVARKKLEEQQRIDQTVFEYDEVYDRMKSAQQQAKEKRDTETHERKPKYIGGFLAAAATRRLDYLRAEEKLIQREREQEGDEFADKEAFVTQAYKDQMKELRRAEEEEKHKNELEGAKKGPTMGMARFYKELLERSEEQHTATVAATAEPSPPIIGPSGPNLTITKPADFTPKSDLELAKQARAAGKTIELNDDNQIVDKRELLSAGLNLSAPNTRNLTSLRNSRTNSKTVTENVQVHRAVGTAASYREINERRQREIEKQLEEEEERLEKGREREEREKRERVVAKRNNEEEIKNARERYLDRKRRRLEEAAAAASIEASERKPA